MILKFVLAWEGYLENAAEIANLSFEEALAELEAVVAKLETGQATLDQSITLYTRGQQLRAHCDARLADAQEKIQKLTLGQDGLPTSSVPFDEQEG